jgi:uncharacterized protein YqeY
MEAELKIRLNDDLKQALRIGDRLKLSVIRSILAAVDKTQSDRQKKLIDDAVSRGGAAGAKGNSILRDGEIENGSVRQIVLATSNKGGTDDKRVDDALVRVVAALTEIVRTAKSEGRNLPDQREMARQAALLAIDNTEIAKQVELKDPDVLDVISKQAKQREESIAAYKQANRLDLVSQEEAELVILKTYLPQAAGHDDIVAVVKQVIAEVGAQGQRDKGKVMQKAIVQLKGRADGRAINEVVTELLK